MILSIFILAQQAGLAVGGFLLSVVLAFGAHTVSAGAPQFSATAVLLTFTLGATLLYGAGGDPLAPHRSCRRARSIAPARLLTPSLLNTLFR